MGKQHHDTGWKKKNRPPRNPGSGANTDTLAAELVTKGLASNLILDRRSPPTNHQKDRP